MRCTGRVTVVLMATLLGCVASAPVHAQPTPADPATLYQQLSDAINGGDLPSILAFYTDDAVLVGSSVGGLQWQDCELHGCT